MSSVYPPFTKAVTIHAAPARVWEVLTMPALMQQWMAETPIEVITTWQPGSPIIIRGDWYKTGFENRGTVLAFEPDCLLSYSHLSSLSRLPDEPANYTTITFRIDVVAGATLLEVKVHNFPTEAIYRHIAFYWNVAAELVKQLAEEGAVGMNGMP